MKREVMTCDECKKEMSAPKYKLLIQTDPNRPIGKELDFCKVQCIKEWLEKNL